MIFVFPFVALLILIAILSVVLTSKDSRQRRLITPCIFGGFLFTLIIGAKCAWQSDIEWNPSIQGDSVVVGTWSDHTQTIVFKPNHTFNYRTPSRTIGGTWKRDDWNLLLRSDQSSILMRFVQFHGRYRLMTQPPDDIDAWNGDAGLKQIQN